MDSTIWKYILRPDREGICTLEMPATRRALSVGEQDGRLVMWATVDPDHASTPAWYVVIPTGGHAPPANTGLLVAFIGTVQMATGLVFHVWELDPRSPTP